MVITPKTIEECLGKEKKCMDRGILPLFVTDERLPETRKFGSGTSEMILVEKKKSNWIAPVVGLLDHSDPATIWKLHQSGARAVLPEPAREGTEKVDFLATIKDLSFVIQSISLQFEHELEQNLTPIHP